MPGVAGITHCVTFAVFTGEHAAIVRDNSGPHRDLTCTGGFQGGEKEAVLRAPEGKARGEEQAQERRTKGPLDTGYDGW